MYGIANCVATCQRRHSFRNTSQSCNGAFGIIGEVLLQWHGYARRYPTFNEATNFRVRLDRQGLSQIDVFPSTCPSFERLSQFGCIEPVLPPGNNATTELDIYNNPIPSIREAMLISPPGRTWFFKWWTEIQRGCSERLIQPIRKSSWISTSPTYSLWQWHFQENVKLQTSLSSIWVFCVAKISPAAIDEVLNPFRVSQHRILPNYQSWRVPELQQSVF